MKTELPLRRLNAAAGTRGELTVATARAPLAVPDRDPVAGLVDDEGRRWYASYELGDGRCLIELPPTGRFLLEPAAGRVLVDHDGEDDELLEHRVVSAAICTLLAARGDLVLHAAAVEVGGRAVAFCGPTRRGKSTLARVLGGAGHGVIGEDGVAIGLGGDGPTAFPGARGVRLRGRGPDGRRRTKLLADPGPGEPAPCPVGALVLLGERGDELEIEALEPTLALALLTSNLVHSGGRASLSMAFGNLARTLHSVPAYRVSLPDELGALPAAAERLLDSIAVRSLDSAKASTDTEGETYEREAG